MRHPLRMPTIRPRAQRPDLPVLRAIAFPADAVHAVIDKLLVMPVEEAFGQDAGREV